MELQHAELGFRLQAVAGLGFGGGGAVGEHALQARAGFVHQRFERSQARLPDGGEDPAAGGQDFQVFGPGHLHFELGGTVPGPDDVGVRVDEAGQDDAAGGVQAGFVGIGSQQLCGWPDGQDGLIPDQDGPVFEDAQVAEGVPALRAAATG